MSRAARLRAALRARSTALVRPSLARRLADDPGRARRYRLHVAPLHIDYSRNRIDDTTLTLLAEYAEERRLPERIAQLFAGEKLNVTEGRPALHWALRAPLDGGLRVAGEDLGPKIAAPRERMRTLAQTLCEGGLRGYSGKPLRHIVNIGIGGSELGARLLHHALPDRRQNGISMDFLSNIDPQALTRTLEEADPETTLFVVCSKSFATAETRQNARSARDWLRARAGAAGGSKAISKQFFAVTNNPAAAVEFGIDREQVLHVEDWVGGRYSLWSAMALPAVLATGFAPFQELLDGAEQMDRHFRDTPLARNAPALLGLLDVWYRSFCGASTMACIPYDEALALLPQYLAQLIMESNGKGVNHAGDAVDPCAPVVWGGVGSDGQHSFGQLLHQGLDLVPADFLVGIQPRGDPRHHAMLFANCLAQTQVLMQGHRDKAAHKSLPGNRPSTLILYETLDATTLGALLALYEHRTFVQAMIWGINPFDQWGVEQGKRLAEGIGRELLPGAAGNDEDAEGPGADNGDDGQGLKPDPCSKESIALYRQHNRPR